MFEKGSYEHSEHIMEESVRPLAERKAVARGLG